MTWLALWLLGVGLMDLLRGVTGPRREMAPVAGASAILVLAVLAGVTAPADIIALVVALVPMVLWWHASERAQGHRGREHVLALSSLALGGLGLLAASGWASPAGGLLGEWLLWSGLPLGDDVGRLLLVAALALTNVATGNIVVRLVLVSVGAIRPGAAAGSQPADRLRGGRLLGPMERLLVLGLGLAGELTAAGLVIGAKGLIRFPELQSRAKDGTPLAGPGIDEITEYFLIGSFVSWLLALGSLVLAH